MRKQPLLALVSTTLTLSSLGLVGHRDSAAAAATNRSTSTPNGRARLTDGEAVSPSALARRILGGLSAPPSSAHRAEPALSTLTLPSGGKAIVWQRLIATAGAAVARRGRTERSAVAHPGRRLAAHTSARHAAQLKASVHPYVSPGGAWLALRECESGDNYGADTGNGYYGAYQFSLATWWGIGYSGLPSSAPPQVQDQAAERLERERGWEPWPVCSVVLGLR